MFGNILICAFFIYFLKVERSCSWEVEFCSLWFRALIVDYNADRNLTGFTADTCKNMTFSLSDDFSKLKQFDFTVY